MGPDYSRFALGVAPKTKLDAGCSRRLRDAGDPRVKRESATTRIPPREAADNQSWFGRPRG